MGSVISLLMSCIVGAVAVPKHYGVFISDAGTQVELASQDVVQRNLVGYMTLVLIGLEDDQVEPLPVVSESAFAIVYGQPQQPSDWLLTRLSYEERYEDALIRRDPFSVNLWVPEEDVRCDLESEGENRDCYVVRPRGQLSPGLYVLHYCSLEPLKHVGTVDRQVFAFVVKMANKGTLRADLRGKSVLCFGFVRPSMLGCYVGSDSAIFRLRQDGFSCVNHPLFKDGIRGIAVDQGNTERMVILLARAPKLLRTEDTGLSWNAVDPDLRDFLGRQIPVLRAYTIVTDSGSPGTLLIPSKTDEGGILLQSTDFGTSWNTSPVRDSSVLAAVFSGDRVLFSTEGSLYFYRFPAVGEVSKVPSAPKGICLLCGSASGETGLFAVSSTGDVYSSEDSTLFFRKIGMLGCSPRALAVRDSTCWVAGERTISCSHDQGKNWQQSALPDSDCVNTVVVNPQDANQLLAGGSNGLYVSDDDGVHWNVLSVVGPSQLK